MRKAKHYGHFSSVEEKANAYKKVYDMYHVEGLSQPEISKKTGYSRTSVYHIIHTFEAENLEYVDYMAKKQEHPIPEDYQKLLEELKSLKKELKQERLRADFYQEMVAYGKEVYGIDLKKAGTK